MLLPLSYILFWLIFFFFLMISPPPRSTLTVPLLPYTTLFRSGEGSCRENTIEEGIAGGDDEVRVGDLGVETELLHQPPLHLGETHGQHDLLAAGHRHQVRHLLRRIALGHLQGAGERSEEHTSELQSLMRISYAVFCLKKK